mgnify:FL=1
MEFRYILLGIAVLCLVWTVLFQVINKNISTRIIKRGEGYTIQVRGKFKWNDTKNSNNESLIFTDKQSAAEILDLAVSAYKQNKG